MRLDVDRSDSRESDGEFTLLNKVLDNAADRRYFSSVGPLRVGRYRPTRPLPGQEHAADHLLFIRETMERAGSFTAVSGWGQTAVGILALAGALVAAQQPTAARWLATWVGVAVVSFSVASWAAWRKAAALGIPLFSGPARRFALSFFPPLLAGAWLTLVFYQAGLADRLPAMWLLLYGTAVVAGGALSIRLVPVMGVCFMLGGVLAFVVPAAWGHWLMAGAFGGLHIIFGVLIGVRHGG